MQQAEEAASEFRRGRPAASGSPLAAPNAVAAARDPPAAAVEEVMSPLGLWRRSRPEAVLPPGNRKLLRWGGLGHGKTVFVHSLCFHFPNTIFNKLDLFSRKFIFYTIQIYI